MSALATVPGWKECTSSAPMFCIRCENFTHEAWAYWATPTTTTHIVCTTCAEKL